MIAGEAKVVGQMLLRGKPEVKRQVFGIVVDNAHVTQNRRKYSFDVR